MDRFGPKSQDCQLKLKFGSTSNPNMQNSVVLSTFSTFDRKNPFLSNLVQKLKIVKLN